ncbi:MAG: SLBB domain-containing protein [Rhodothermaceae bacterium]|nr:SLBB domain-containing protein [Rhodothermaceae bacterium]
MKHKMSSMINTFYLKGIPVFIILLSTFFGFDTHAQDLKLGDGVRLTFYNIEDDVSGDYFVMRDGTIQLPYIGLIHTQQKPFPSIQESIIKSYKSIYREPELTVQPLFRINVLGEVKAPGIYFVTGYERLTDLLAMAGGETLEADLDKLYLLRDDERIDINAKRIVKEGKSLQDLGMRSGDQVYIERAGLVSYRNASLLISGIGVAATIAAIFIVRN